MIREVRSSAGHLYRGPFANSSAVAPWKISIMRASVKRSTSGMPVGESWQTFQTFSTQRAAHEALDQIEQETPMKTPTATPAIVQDRAVQESIESCNRLYADSGLLMAQSAVKMILLGHELLRLRKLVKHGGWQDLFAGKRSGKSRNVATFAFAYDTADRAMKLAQKARDKIKILEAHADASLAALPDARREAVLGAVRKTVGAESYQQLAWDWGIAKQPPRLGGHHPKGEGDGEEPPKSQHRRMEEHEAAYYGSLDAAEQEAYDIWRPLIRDLQREAFEARSFVNLAERELTDLRGAVAELHKLLRRADAERALTPARDVAPAALPQGGDDIFDIGGD